MVFLDTPAVESLLLDDHTVRLALGWPTGRVVPGCLGRTLFDHDENPVTSVTTAMVLANSDVKA
jgi:hypothetical protein